MRFLKHKKGMEMTKWIYGFIGLFVLLIVAINLLPTIVQQINDSLGNYTGATKALIVLVPLFVVIAVVIAVVVYAMGHGKK